MQDGGSQGMDHEQQHVLKIRLEMKILGPTLNLLNPKL